MNIKDMYSVFEYEKGRFCIRTLVLRNTNDNSKWQYEYYAVGGGWYDKWNFNNGFNSKTLLYFSSKEDAEEVINHTFLSQNEW